MKQPFRINQRVKIKEVDGYTYDERFPCLAPNSEGRVIQYLDVSRYMHREIQLLVRFNCGTFPMYKEELEKL